MRDLDGIEHRDGLDRRLSEERSALLDGLHVPELGVIRSRARVVRLRRRLATGTAALALLAVVGAGVALVHDGRTAPPPEVAAGGSPTWIQPTYRGSGLTLYGLAAYVDDRPGAIHDIQFTDGERGYLLLADCKGGAEPCRLTLLGTTDRGRRWHDIELPQDTAPASDLPWLVPLGTEQLGLFGERAWMYGPGGWTPLNGAPVVASVPKGGRLWTRPGTGCDPGPLYVWGMDATLGTLATAPPMQVCRVAGGPGGAWWVGGYDNVGGRRPVVAVSRDAGRSWQSFPLPAAGPDAWAQVSPLGTEVYASVVSPRGGQPYPDTVTLHAVYRSAGGGPFQRYGPTEAAFVGDLVPLLDGRLLVAGPMWYVSEGGKPFVKDTAGLPFVGRFARTPGGWVAYDLFQSGYAAVSRDGVEWHKFNIR